ncbi:MAG: hypothetical protein M5U01_38665 [Ardenticatenaceae bacterium]|nr:hypothetical protein [Ardenticatenaceae bacterium]
MERLRQPTDGLTTEQRQTVIAETEGLRAEVATAREQVAEL